MSNARIVPFALALLVGVALAQSKPEPRPLVVGVVDVTTTWKRYARYRDLEHVLATLRDELETEERRLAGAVERLRKLDTLTALDREELRVASKAFATYRELADERLRQRGERLRHLIQGEIDAAIRELGERDGYDLILRTGGVPAGNDVYENRSFRAQVEPVLYGSSRLDLTRAVLELLNDPEALARRPELK